jgi:hypothetical protein
VRNRYASRQAESAVIYGDGTRHCAWCGDYIDPIDWCLDCKAHSSPCATTGGPHRRLRKRSDAAFCDSGCRATYQRDTGPQLVSRKYR